MGLFVMAGFLVLMWGTLIFIGSFTFLVFIIKNRNKFSREKTISLSVIFAVLAGVVIYNHRLVSAYMEFGAFVLGKQQYP